MDREPFVSGTRPYSNQERARDSQDQVRRTQVQSRRRKATPSGQNYNRHATAGHMRNYRQQQGERD